MSLKPEAAIDLDDRILYATATTLRRLADDLDALGMSRIVIHDPLSGDTHQFEVTEFKAEEWEEDA